MIHRRAGKTVMAVMKLIDAALKNKHQFPPPRYSYVAPFFKQAKTIAWSYLKHYARKVPGTKVNEAETWVEFANGARISIVGADNPDSLRGIYLDGVVMDEMAQMKPDVWDEIVYPALADRKGWALFIGTPKGVNRFSELHSSAKTKAGWFSACYTVHETDVFTAEEIKQMEQDMPENKFRQEMLCDITAANDDALFSLSKLLEVKGRGINEHEYTFAAKVIGVDVARQGDDRTVIQMRQGLATFKPITMEKADAMVVAARVATEIQRHNPDAVLVDGTGGYGAGVIDRLRQMGHDVMEVQFGGKPDDPRFKNKRVEMFWRLKEWVDQGGVLPDEMDLIRELAAITYWYDNAKGEMRLNSKDEVKEQLGVSPDMADALACTFAFHVAPKAMTAKHSRQAARDYDPYS